MIKVSIIIVSYHDEEFVFKCLDSLKNTKINLQIIVTDNASSAHLKSKLTSEYSYVKYVRSTDNLGYGYGCNFGAQFALGEYLFFLNPDTIVYPDCIKNLLDFITKNPLVGIVSPLLLDKNKKVFEKQGTTDLTPITAIFSLSAVHKYFPNNSFAKRYWLTDWNKLENKLVGVSPGTAMLMSATTFKKLNGFDQNIFIYYEECDLCLRAKKIGLSTFIIPSAKIIHYWGSATPDQKINQKRMSISRDYYMQKYFGYLSKFFVKLVCDLKI